MSRNSPATVGATPAEPTGPTAGPSSPAGQAGVQTPRPSSSAGQAGVQTPGPSSSAGQAGVQTPGPSTPPGRIGTRIARATARRVLSQLGHDPRTVGMLVLVPLLLIGLLSAMFSGPAFDRVALIMAGVFPFTILFLITSIAMLRERRTGTLERLLTTPTRPVDLIGGYGLAFSVAAAVQALVVVAALYLVFGVRTAAGPAAVMGIAVLTALLGVGLGLCCSAFARTEFQAVQMLPVVVIPQLLLCGLFVSRSEMAGWLRAVANVLPMSHAVDLLQRAASTAAVTGAFWRDLAVVAGCVILALGAAAATMRRQTK